MLYLNLNCWSTIYCMYDLHVFFVATINSITKNVKIKGRKTHKNQIPFSFLLYYFLPENHDEHHTKAPYTNKKSTDRHRFTRINSVHALLDWQTQLSACNGQMSNDLLAVVWIDSMLQSAVSRSQAEKRYRSAGNNQLYAIMH